jgi:toluene monooxygenase system protein D
MGKMNKVGPVLRTGEIATAVVEAVIIDNPDKEITVKDHIAYVRVETDHECIIRRDTIEQCLGRPFRMQEIEIDLSSFAGQIDLTEDSVRFYLEMNL